MSILLLATAFAASAAQPETTPQETAGRIAAEATRSNDDALGRPLPLAAHWNSGHDWNRRGMTPAFQVSLVEKGHHHLVGLLMPGPGHNFHDGDLYYEAPMRRLAELRLPFTLIASQWESRLTTEKRWFELPAEANPNVINASGKPVKMVSPFGPVDGWRECGQSWTDHAYMHKLAGWYPDPSRVLFLSNNEHAKLAWTRAESGSRYLARYGKGRDDEFKRRVFAEGWIERYRALQAGMRERLPNKTWRKAAMFIGYDAFGPVHLARWGGWSEYSLYQKGRVDPWPLAWDGGSPSYYVHNWNPSTDHTVWGPQVESQNWLFMLDEAFKLNPGFWWEISLWDGHEAKRNDDKRKVYASRGQTYGPARYRGMVQFGMWLLRPRAVREFRGWTDTREDMMPYFQQVLDSVDALYRSPTLAEFWRQGRLVPNRAHKHPYQEGLPDELQDLDRWFQLDTSEDPPRPWKLETVIPVFAIALELGERPARRWLVYAHAPLGDRKGVNVTLPGFGEVAMEVAVGGSFTLVQEQGGRTVAID